MTSEQSLMHIWTNRQRLRHPPAVGELAKLILKDLEASPPDPLDELRELWEEWSPPEIRAHAWPVRFASGTISFEAISPAGRFQVQRDVGPRFVECVRRRLPHLVVRGLKVRTGRSRQEQNPASPWGVKRPNG